MNRHSPISTFSLRTTDLPPSNHATPLSLLFLAYPTMSDSKFPDENIFKRVFRFICKIWIWISVIVMVRLLRGNNLSSRSSRFPSGSLSSLPVCRSTALAMVSHFANDTDQTGFRHQTDNVYWYGGSPYCGYADQTPFPKHLGGVTYID